MTPDCFSMMYTCTLEDRELSYIITIPKLMAFALDHVYLYCVFLGF